MATVNLAHGRGVYSETYSTNAASVNLFNVGEVIGAQTEQVTTLTAYILHASVTISVAGTSNRVALVDSITSLPILRNAGTVVDSITSFDPNQSTATKNNYRGYALSPGASLVCTQAGTPGTIEVCVVFEVK